MKMRFPIRKTAPPAFSLVLALLIALGAGMAGLAAATPGPAVDRWVGTTPLTPARSFAGTAVYQTGSDSWIYAVGGLDATGTATNEVRFARIDAYGNLEIWQATTPLPTALYLHATVIARNYIYVIGGYDGTNRLATVRRAEILGDGSLSSWTQVGTVNYPFPVVLHSAVVHNNRIYISGGEKVTGSTAGGTREVYFTNVTTDGSLSAWTPAALLPSPLYRHAIAAYDDVGGDNDTLYVTGGWNGSAVQDKVYRGQITPGTGQVTSWQEQQLPERREYHQAFVVTSGTQPRLVLAGGRKGTALADELASVKSAVIGDTDGSLGTWEDEPALFMPLYRAGGGVLPGDPTPDTLYLVGGVSGGSATPVVYRTAPAFTGDQRLYLPLVMQAAP
jgi:hypothetical protein